MIINPDIIVEIRFKTHDEGGRESSLFGEFYPCPLFIDGEAFECRVLLGNKRIELGQWYQLPVQFLHRDLVVPMLSPGKPVALWEGKEVASGKVLEVLPKA